MLLLIQGRRLLNLPERTFIIIASFSAIVAISLLFKTSQNIQLKERQDRFKQVKNRVFEGLQKEIDIILDELNSLEIFLNRIKTLVYKNLFIFRTSFSN